MGNRVGLFEHTRSHGEFTALLCRYVRAMMPGFAFAAVACFSNLASEHVDVNHAPGSRILIAPLSSFKDGQVKIHVQPPQFLQVADGPCLLDPSLPHSTWQGDRVVLVAHMPKNVRLLSLADLDVLKGLGFGLGALTHLPASIPASPSLPALAESPGPKPKKLWPPPGPLLPQAAAYGARIICRDRVSACLRSFGVAAFGVDRDTSKAKAKCMEADLATAEGRELVLFWLRNPRLAGIFAAPMCGTCSRARQLSNGPPPLRSESCADGLPNLSAHDQARVGEANAAYRCLTECLLQALDRSLLIIVENPLRSIFWLCSAWKPLAGRLHFAWCHACAYGSTRPKKTAFASNTPLIHAITRYCAGPSCEKNHEPWGQDEAAPTGFATSKETAYPPLMAMKLAWIIGQSLQQSGWQPAAALPAPHDHIMSLQALRACAGNQPKASRFPPLVPEARATMVVKSPKPLALPCAPMQRLDNPWPLPAGVAVQPAVTTIPAKAQLLRATPITVKTGEQASPSQPTWEYAWAIPFTEEEFIAKAAEARHPRTFESQLPGILRNTIDRVCKADESEVASARTAFISKWADRAKELKPDEAALTSHGCSAQEEKLVGLEGDFA